jgi:DNA mismatch repair ATPase MutS
LIKQLIKERTIAVIATHDVELSQVAHENGSLQNYHFDVQVDEEDELYFDYKLKPGICTNLNASILMRKIGIELEEQQKNVKV